MKKIFIILLLILSPTIVSATITETDSTPTVAEVQTLVDNATAGDTVKFMGNATWSTTVTIGKAITIDGNSKTLTSSGSLSQGFFYINGFTSTDLVRITGFTFQMAGAERGIYSVDVDLTQLRIDHNTFHHGGTQMEITGAKGVIDNNYFYNHRGYSIVYSAGSRAQADASWVSMAAGTSDALFIEDNHFIKDANYTGSSYGTDIDTDNGGKLVIRYNTWNSTTSPASILSTIYPIQLHGNACGGCDSVNKAYWQNDATARRGQSVVEIYNNTMAGRRIDRLATIRGSAVLIHDNAITGTVAYDPQIYFYEEEYYLDSQFYPLRTAWPAEDQTHNTFIWNNTYKGYDFNDGVYGYVSADNAASGLLKDRDFFLHAPCGASDSVDAYGNACTHGKERFVTVIDCTSSQTPYKCCTGNGTGNCRNGASESSPTDGSTYSNYGTMIFEATGDNFYYGYTPYTYPHPLRGLGNRLSGGVVAGGTF